VGTYQKYGKGHHWVGWEVYKHFPKLPEETGKVFENAASGPLADPTANWFNREHRAYDKAVVQAFEDFLKEKNTTEDKATPEQADEFWRRMRWNSDPAPFGGGFAPLMAKPQRSSLWLNACSVIAESAAASSTPRWAYSMIFSATACVTMSFVKLRPSVLQTLS
jgi:hypothetical protein